MLNDNLKDFRSLYGLLQKKKFKALILLPMLLKFILFIIMFIKYLVSDKILSDILSD